MAITLYGSKQNVIQVVNTIYTGNFSSATNQTLLDITGFNASITPSSSSNKILVQVSCALGLSASTSIAIGVTRNGTAIGTGASAGSRLLVASRTFVSSIYWINTLPAIILDSPATTSAVTYQVQVAIGSGTGYVNRNSNYGNDGTVDQSLPASTITLMEIAYA